MSSQHYIKTSQLIKELPGCDAVNGFNGEGGIKRRESIVSCRGAGVPKIPARPSSLLYLGRPIHKNITMERVIFK